MRRRTFETKNLGAFLDMIAFSEIGPQLLQESDDGYNVVVGSVPGHPILFHSYADHPRKLVHLRPGLASSAAGRYQVLERNYDFYKLKLRLPDFSPESQDAIAAQLVKECHAFSNLVEGDFEGAVHKCAHIWASLPGAGYGQHENKMEALREAFIQAGGVLA